MLGTDFRTGSPMWIDLGSPDTEAAAAFYGAVFGWRVVSAGPQAGGYGFFQKDAKIVAALGPLTEAGASPAWTTYFRSDDIEATARQVVAGGGSVRVEPMSVGEGRLAQFTDPQGAQFAVLHSAMGLQKASEDDTLVWVELHAADPEAAIRFYQGLFDWRSRDMQAPGMTYRVLSIAYGDQQQGSFGGVAQLQGEREEARWVPYFAVADADAVVEAVRDNGGTVRMPAADVPDVGRIAWLEDPSEAVFAVLKPNPRQG
ncbi:putative enzyme related to lactoylglutathione lyase [Streptomyces griseochromogenes]|uniref:Enzyme related to lactoylglutathione lyase n=1 Tax=Streptomyces griseochromogenes TaxID=68214 RepID=A0A1B1B179_9ACTN|nr:VOC family protein [Streptomyces griseochromogenes]ANP52511.1 hydroxylase [Streptomyces griseochromogenes]MBP2056238.1 putative enzyme related to lactoylglutathione lyase [Streptomyces griseochromogenes]